MSILLDTRGYLGLRPILQKRAQGMGIDVDVKDLNGKGWGDLVVFGLDGIYQVEIKEAGEYIGDVDHLISQIKSQAPNADYTYIFIYGEQMPAEDGNSYSLQWVNQRVLYERGPDSSIERGYRRRHHRVPHSGQRKILWRMRQEGIQVIECRDLEELAYELCIFHDTATTIGTTFTRLVPEKFNIQPYPPEKANFMLSIMGLMPKWGGAEEVAEAVAEWVTAVNPRHRIDQQLTIRRLMDLLELECDYPLEQQPLRNSLKEGARKRTIGPSVVRNLMKVLGI
jgi:hypothetical protein